MVVAAAAGALARRRAAAVGRSVDVIKAKLTPSAGSNGSVILQPMQRFIVTVPINPQPFLTITGNLKVTSPSNEGATIAFEGDVEFPLDMAQRGRAIHTELGEVQVRISYN